MPRHSYQLNQPVFLIGFMGSGKTSVARKLARKCGVASVDMDTYIERRENRSISEIFETDGEEAFRDIESEALTELLKLDPALIACGGGVITRPANCEAMTSSGLVVYLKVTPEEAAERISDVSTRPLFQDLSQARSRYEEREPLYEELADLTIETAGRPIPLIAQELQRKLVQEKVLCQQPE